MGEVWAARLKGTRGFRKLVAVKTILSAVDDARLEQMLYREATLASQIHHPNVAEILELGEHEGSLYLAMELVEGDSLAVILREARARGGVPLSVAVQLIGQVCQGLSAAHELCDANGERIGLVHRDISPPNVLVTYTGTVKLVDFGVATTAASRTYRSGEIKGKISYLSPEQLRGESLDARVDVFATGILLYLLTVGRHPFRVGGEADTIARLLSPIPATPPSAFIPDYPAELEAVLMRAIDKNKEKRFASASAFLEALERAWPFSFGPNGRKATAEYIQDLLKLRMNKQRHQLKQAEEWSEFSASRDSALAVPQVLAPRPLRHPSSRIGFLALAALAFAVAAGATLAHLMRAAEPAAFAVELPRGPRTPQTSVLAAPLPAASALATPNADVERPFSTPENAALEAPARAVVETGTSTPARKPRTQPALARSAPLHKASAQSALRGALTSDQPMIGSGLDVIAHSDPKALRSPQPAPSPPLPTLAKLP
jgi:serine/threonine-protein kinase